MSLRRRFSTAVLGLLALGVVNPATAAADAPGPTDYQSEVIDVSPAHDGIALQMIGGDSFLQLEVDQGVEVMVIGYRGEDYLWFAADGTVYENERSPSVYLNEDRFGEDIPIDANADPDADPVWSEVATNGRYSWHDHRTHWMNRARPPAAEPGDIILEAVVPLVVDGEAVSVTVNSVWVDPPSPVGVIAGAAIALAVLAILVVRAGRTSGAAVATGVSAGAALVIGIWQVVSLPSETGPSPLLWLLPLVAAICAAAAIVSILRQGWDDLISGLVMLGALDLALWSWLRFDGLTNAILPTNAPFGLDRAVTIAALIIGLASLILAGSELAKRLTTPIPTVS